MKKIYVLLLAVLSFTANSFAQVTVAGADAVTNAGSPYTTLKLAFDNINLAAQTGNVIVISITGNTTEIASAVLNASAGAWTSLSISPSGGGARTITGAITGNLIDLNGADNVTIDGLNTGGNSLTIENTTSGASSTAIRFIADATNNIIQNCTIKGAGTSATLGTVFFSTGTVTGNDGNNINNCNINSSGANFATNAVYSLGTSAAIDNSGNILNANNISDYFITTGSASIGIFLAATGNSTWTISNNRLFQTATRLYTTSQSGLCGMSIQSGSGYTITGNIIGYANSGGTGTTNMIGNTITLAGFPGSYAVAGTANATRYIAISCAFTAGGAVSSIQNNTIAGFALYTSSGAATTNGILCGINITSGNADIGTTTGNTIGATTGNGSLYTACTTPGGAIVGIYATSVNTVNIRNNTIGALDAMGTAATGNGGITGINSAGALGNFDISGNTIGNATDPNLRTGNLTTAGLLSNTGTTFGISSGIGVIRGILNSATGVITIGTPALPNTIRNASNNSSSASASFRGIDNSGGGTGGFSISSNIISNFTSQSTNTTLGTGALAGIGIYNTTITSGLAGSNIILNTITGLSLTNTTASGTNVTGISIANLAVNILRNKICDIRNASTSVSTLTPGTASGIFQRSATAGANENMVNNMISLGNAQTTNTCFVGIWIQCGSTPNPISNIYYNTINIEGAVAAGAQPSFAVLRGSFIVTVAVGNVVTVDIRNNILNNTRTGGTGGHYAIANFYGTTTITGGTIATGWGVNASNYNVLNAANAAKVGNWTTDQTFAGWKTASASDAYSLTAIPVTFVSTCDLHINMGVTPTSIESGGTVIAGFTTDYDNQVRPGPAGSVNGGALAPDIGADEFDGVFLDIFGPVITYTALFTTNCLTNRTFTATVTDPSSVNVTAGTKPRVYYKRSTDADTWVDNLSTSNGWKYAEASNAVSPFSFTIDYSLLFGGGGIIVGDNVQYFVVAQDLVATPNVSINSGTFAVAPVSVALTATAFPMSGTINSYNIVTGLATTLTVGAAGNYTSLTGAAGLFNAINTNGLIGNTTVNILDALVTETGAVALNQIQSGGCSATSYTLLIKPDAGMTSALTGSLTSSLIRILSSNVTIDGSNNGTTSRNLTMTNTSVTTPTVVLLGSTGTTPIINTTLKNSFIINGSNTASAVVVSDGAVSGNAGYFNNITIQNNSVQQSYIGIYNIAVSAAGNGSGLLITGNDLNTAGANSIRLVGLYVQGVDGATLSNNNIGNITNILDASNITGIWFATGTVNSTISGNTINTISSTAAGSAPRGIALSPAVSGANINVTGNTITGLTSSSTGTTTGILFFSTTAGVTIQKNTISNIKNTNVTGYGSNGIQLSSTSTAAAANVYNNFIFDIAGIGFAGAALGDNGYGIVVSSGAGYNIDFNSINLNTDQTLVTGIPAAINITSGVTTAGAINLRNNIFANNQTVLSGVTTRYAIYSGAANTVFGTIDYNDYYSAGTNLGNIGGVDRPNLAAIQAGFGGNTNSLNVQPNFTSSTDLHLLAATNCRLDGYGNPVAGITTDIDNQTRDAGAPDMGADEFTTSPVSTTMVSASVCDTKNVSPLGTTYIDASCDLIARVLPIAPDPVAGKIRTCVTLDVSQMYHNGEPYVQRHYDIEPTTSNQTTTSATLTLYFTNAEFALYNFNNPARPPLPTNGAGNTPANRNNVKVTQFHGVGFGSPTAPGNYPGVRVLIVPGAANVVFNGTFWEITFNVAGFSGFYVHTNNFNAPLPITVNYFTGTKQGSNHLLAWKVTCNSTPSVTMTLERSASSAGGFTGINTINATAARCNQPFNYTDAQPLKGMNYYRLKMVDVDGKISYSSIVALLNAVKGFDIVSIAPNPVTNGNFKLNVASAQSSKMELVIFDMQGRLVNRQTVSVIAGYNSVPINVVNLAAGTYTVQATIADDRSRVMRFVIQ